LSQLRHFLAGRETIPNYPTDVLVWLNYQGYKFARVHGKPPEIMIKRDDQPSVSLEKYLSKLVEYLYHPEMSLAKIEELYVRFTNRMDSSDADIVYKATEGKLELDLDFVKKYAGDRKIGDDPRGEYIFREEWLPEETEQPKTEAGAEPPKQRGRRGKAAVPAV
jgi:hypothetical protein